MRRNCSNNEYSQILLQSCVLQDTIRIPYLLITMTATTTSTLSEAFIFAGIFIAWIEHTTYPWFTQLLNDLYQYSWEATGICWDFHQCKHD